MCLGRAGDERTGCSGVIDFITFGYYYFKTVWILKFMCNVENKKHQQKSKANSATGIMPVWVIPCWATGLWCVGVTVVCGIAWRKVHLG